MTNHDNPLAEERATGEYSKLTVFLLRYWLWILGALVLLAIVIWLSVAAASSQKPSCTSEQKRPGPFCYIPSDPNFNPCGCQNKATAATCRETPNQAFTPDATKCRSAE